MELKNKLLLAAMGLSISMALVACGDTDNSADSEEEGLYMEESEDSVDDMDHSHMHMSGSGEVPDGLEDAQNPAFEEGDTAVITEGHMEGMEGAEATIVGAYDTVAYSISYDPVDGGERVENHKWIIHEEVADFREEPYAEGDEVEVNADHMEGMDGALAIIDSVEETTVYMIDFTLTTSGEEVTNHKWMTEEELSAE